MTTYPVRVVSQSNLSIAFINDTIRSAANRGGKPGIEAKRGQTDRRIKRKGYARLRFTERHHAIAFARRLEQQLEEIGVTGVTIRRCVNRSRRKRR